METKASIHTVGNYTYKRVDQDACNICHNADWADVIIDGKCSKCIREKLEKLEKLEKITERISATVKASVSEIEDFDNWFFEKSKAMADYEAYKAANSAAAGQEK